MMSEQNYEQLILHGIQGLPQETLDEIIDFIYFVRQRTLQPQVFAEERQLALLGKDLKGLRHTEERHLEEEFADYDRRYPRE